jgi:hypothetical protein
LQLLQNLAEQPVQRRQGKPIPQALTPRRKVAALGGVDDWQHLAPMLKLHIRRMQKLIENRFFRLPAADALVYARRRLPYLHQWCSFSHSFLLRILVDF